MAPPVSNIEALIGKATSPLNRNEDPNVIQKICQAVVTEPLGMQTAIRLIAHKIQSPQEWEAMQTLLILQSCVNNCGKMFHSEVGKFRFLNEMIKIVSPNYLGNHRPVHIKKKICELLYTWTIDIAHEPKIAEAYQMLKNQKIIQEDPMYLGLSLPAAENKTKIVFRDAEKSKRLQQLLQSKKPEDVLEANALIKKIVRDDERKLERSTRRSIEVETALNNASVLDEMISQYESLPGGQADLELMSELNDSCTSIQTSIYRLVADLDEKEEGIGDLLTANDELSRVMGRYKLKIKKENVPNHCNAEKVQPKREEALLDLNPRLAANDNDIQAPKEDKQPPPPPEPIFAEKAADVQEKLELISILDDPMSGATGDSIAEIPSQAANSSFLPELLIPEKPYQTQIVEEDEEMLKLAKPLYDLDFLGSSIIRQHLPPNSSPMGSQFKAKEKVSLNQLKCQQIEACQMPSVSNSNSLTQSSSLQSATNKTDHVTPVMTSPDASSLSTLETLLSTNCDDLQVQPSNDDVSSPIQLKSSQTNGKEGQKDDTIHVKPPSSSDDFQIQLADIVPDDSRPPTEVIDRNLMKVTVHHTLNRPREDTSVFVVTTASTHSTVVSNYNLHVIPPEGCTVRLLDPSSTTFSPLKPFLPSPVVTQILLFTSPNQITDDALRLILKYKVGEKTQADYGELELTGS